MAQSLFQQLPWRSLPLVAGYLIVFSVLQLLKPHFDYFEFKVTDLQLSQLWRMVTGHLVHNNLNHLLMNSAGFVALWCLHGQFYRPKQLTIFIFLSCIFISIFLVLFDEINAYVGFSGVLHALVCWGALEDIRHKDKTGYLLLAALIGKILYEQLFGASQSTKDMIGIGVATQAHLAGALFGLFYFVARNLRTRAI